MAEAAAVVYVTDRLSDGFDRAELFDLAYLLESSDHDLRAVVTTDANDGTVWDDLITAADVIDKPPLIADAKAADVARVLKNQSSPVNLVVIAGYETVAALLQNHQEIVRAFIARLFLVGGQINSYTSENTIERLPIDPRLRERNPERFAESGDIRIRTTEEQTAFAAILTCGEAVIWLPRDICLWQYATNGVLEHGGRLCDFLLGQFADSSPVLLSALPAFLLAYNPDASLWLRLFRAIPARVSTDDSGKVHAFVTKSESPNLYAVIAIDGQSLGKMLTSRLRDRPL